MMSCGRPVHQQQLISCLADHRCGVHLVGGGGTRRPYSAWAAGQQVHVVATAPPANNLMKSRRLIIAPEGALYGQE
jgi:hypothetical protein